MSIEQQVIQNLRWLHLRALQFCRTKDDADDLVSDTVYRILRKESTFDSSLAFRPWALRIMRNIYIDNYNIQKQMPIKDLEESVYDMFVLDEDVYRGDILLRQTLKSYVGRYPQIRCVMLYADGYNCMEIADIVCIPVATVRTRIHYGRKILKKLLQHY